MNFPPEVLVYPYRPSAVLRITGPDAPVFLQGQFTNDLGNIKPGSAVYGLWLDRKGRVMGDSHVLAGGEGTYWVVSLHSLAGDIAAHLGSHIIADEVDLADETETWRGVAVIGAGSGDWLRGAARAGLVFAGRRGLVESWEWLFTADMAPGAEAAVAGVPALGAAEVERMRILAGIPSVPADIGPSDLPNEGGLDAQAISYTKGCYTGQEVMARIRSMGRVRRTLARVSGTGSPPPLPAALWIRDRREGELRSAVASGDGYVGLALISVAGADAGRRLSLHAGGPETVAVAALP